MITLALLLLGAALGFAVSRALRLPAIPFLIVGGFALSRLIELPQDLLEDALMLGVTVMVFVAGIELNPSRVGGQRKAAVQVGVLQFLVLGGFGGGAALLMGFDGKTVAYLALALTASSTLVAVRILQTRGQLFEPMGRMVTGALLLQDLFVILLIPVLTRLPDGGQAIALGVLGTLGLVALSGALLHWVSPRLIPRFGREEEPLLLFILSVLFLFLGLAWVLGLPLVSGAFLAGVALSPFPAGALIRSQLNSLSDFFTAIFFTALGSILILPSAGIVLKAVFFGLVVVLLTPPLVAFVAERAGFSARSALQGGLLLSQTSEFSLVIALQGMIAGHLVPEIFGLIALITILTMVLTPFLLNERVIWGLVRIHPSRRRPPAIETPSDHILLVGCGSNGTSLLEFLLIGPHPVWVLDDDPSVVAQLRDAGIEAIHGDAADPVALNRAGAPDARLVISTIRRARDNARLLEIAAGRRVLIRIFEAEDARWVEAQGGTPVDYSAAAADSLLQWMEEEGPQGRSPRLDPVRTQSK
jgi:Kef-type K+ transport system membrane component KefB